MMLSKQWQPGIIRIDKCRNTVELGYVNPVLNTVSDMKASGICFLKKYGSSRI